MVAAEMIPVHNRLRSFRQARGFAIYGLAVLAQCSPTTIGAVERWDYKPTLPVRTRLAQALGVALSDIWPEGAPEMAT